MSFFLGLIFTISSTGIVIFHSYCSCSGKEQISLYTSPPTCEENFHKHHTHDCCGNEVVVDGHQCHECSGHMEDCGCTKPVVRFIKLIDQLTNEELKFKHIQSENQVSFGTLITCISDSKPKVHKKIQNYISPPPFNNTSFDFLIQIHQLKIPFQA